MFAQLRLEIYDLENGSYHALLSSPFSTQKIDSFCSRVSLKKLLFGLARNFFIFSVIVLMLFFISLLKMSFTVSF